MAKEKHLDIVGTTVKGAKVMSYEGKSPAGSHTYKVKFPSGNVAVRTRASVRKGLVDTVAKKKATKKKNVGKTKAKGQKSFDVDEQHLFGIVAKTDNILVLDQATKNTGYTVIQNGVITAYGNISQKSPNRYIRSKEMISDIEVLRTKYNIKAVVLESIYLGYNPMTFRALAELLGALVFYCICKDISVMTVPYSVWSSLNGLHGKRTSLKIQSVKKAMEVVGGNLQGDDVADSILIANYFLTSRGISRNVDWG